MNAGSMASAEARAAASSPSEYRQSSSMSGRVITIPYASETTGMANA